MAMKIASMAWKNLAGRSIIGLIRGSSALSNHAFAIATDINPDGNALKIKGSMPKFAVDAFKKQGARWGGDYKGRKTQCILSLSA